MAREHGTVLVIEDDQATVRLIRAVLEEEGYAVLQAVGEEGLQAALRVQPDLILLNNNMPGMDGPTVSQHLRAHAATAAIPIISMSAHERRGEMPVGMQANAHLAKPFTLDTLCAEVARWMGRREATG